MSAVHLAERDGCSCVDSIRCVHFDGKVLVLHRDTRFPSLTGWWVCYGDVPEFHAEFTHAGVNPRSISHYKSLEEAEAAFAAEAERLRG